MYTSCCLLLLYSSYFTLENIHSDNFLLIYRQLSSEQSYILTNIFFLFFSFEFYSCFCDFQDIGYCRYNRVEEIDDRASAAPPVTAILNLATRSAEAYTLCHYVSCIQIFFPASEARRASAGVYYYSGATFRPLLSLSLSLASLPFLFLDGAWYRVVGLGDDEDDVVLRRFVSGAETHSAEI